MSDAAFRNYLIFIAFLYVIVFVVAPSGKRSEQKQTDPYLQDYQPGQTYYGP